MKIALISDTHSSINNMFIPHLKEADEIWHAGDIGSNIIDKLESYAKVRAVYGNIDDYIIRQSFPKVLHFEINNISFVLTHIANYGGTYAPAIRNILYKNTPDVLISGHSHILKIVKDSTLKMLHINPGSAGSYGIHKVNTMVVFKITNKIENLKVIEAPRNKKL